VVWHCCRTTSTLPCRRGLVASGRGRRQNRM